MSTCRRRSGARKTIRRGLPWSTGIYTEKRDSGPSSDRSRAGKLLIVRELRGKIPQPAEQGNKSKEQGDEIDDQEIKLPEHATRATGQIGAAAAAGWGSPDRWSRHGEIAHSFRRHES